MKPIVFAVIGAALTLSACSEQAACISRVNSELKVIQELTDQTRANVARGYAIGTREIQVPTQERCVVQQPDGSQIVQICPTLETQTQTFPVAIDLNAERAKLASLEERLARVQAETQRKAAQCRARYPE